jgi:hypothetical protein
MVGAQEYESEQRGDESGAPEQDQRRPESVADGGAEQPEPGPFGA